MRLHPLQNVSLGCFTLLTCSGRQNCPKSIYAHAKLLFYFIIIKPIALLLFSLMLLLLMLKPPIYFFPCRSQFGPKNNRTFSFTSHLLFFILSRCLTLWLLVNTLCICTSGLSCQFAWVNKYWNYTTMVFSSSEVVSPVFYLKENNAQSLKSMAILLRILKINSPWGVAKISSMIKCKNSHPQTPIKTTSTHLFYSKSALIFYWHPKTLLIPQPVEWIKLMVKFPFGFHTIHMQCDYQRDWLHPVHCTLDESDMKYC